MSVFQETIWALWISHGRHSQTSIKHVDTLSGVLLTRLKNWSKLIRVTGPWVPLQSAVVLLGSYRGSRVKPGENSCLENTPSSCPWLCPKQMMCRTCPSVCSSRDQARPGICRNPQNTAGSVCRALPSHGAVTPVVTPSGLEHPRSDVAMASGASCTLTAAVRSPSHLLQQQFLRRNA